MSEKLLDYIKDKTVALVQLDCTCALAADQTPIRPIVISIVPHNADGAEQPKFMIERKIFWKSR